MFNYQQFLKENNSFEQFKGYYFYVLETPITYSPTFFADDISQTLSYYGYTDGINEVERRYGYDVSWLKDEVDSLRREKESENEELEEGEEPEESDDNDLLDQVLNDQWKSLSQDIDDLKMEYNDLKHPRNIQEKIFNSFNESDLAQYLDPNSDDEEVVVGKVKSIQIKDLKDIDLEDQSIQITIISIVNLGEIELNIVREYLNGQFSDGWGEGFEQHEVENVYIHTWEHENEMSKISRMKLVDQGRIQ